MAEFENLGGFLEHVSLVMDNAAEAGGDMVNLMTLHSAKGLEFDTVFLPGWEEGLFPNQRALDDQGRVGLEEERRLAHVGVTRAQQRAKIANGSNGFGAERARGAAGARRQRGPMTIEGELVAKSTGTVSQFS